LIIIVTRLVTGLVYGSVSRILICGLGSLSIEIFGSKCLVDLFLNHHWLNHHWLSHLAGSTARGCRGRLRCGGLEHQGGSGCSSRCRSNGGRGSGLGGRLIFSRGEVRNRHRTLA
jgi:hypothetical protein